MARFPPVLLLLGGLVACGNPDRPDRPDPTTPTGGPTDTGHTGRTTAPTLPPNILLVLADDLGVDKVRSYQPTLPDLPRQPTLDALAADGVRFDTVYATPICSPARGILLTGRYPHQTGLGRNVGSNTLDRLPLGELLLPEALDLGPHDWATAAFGKWHLTHVEDTEAKFHPTDSGFDLFTGTLLNLNLESYYSHRLVKDELVQVNTTYATTRTVDDAAAWIATAPEPWFAFVSFHAPHTPMEAPPDSLLATPLDPAADDVAIHGAMIEAMDTELGRLLDGIDPDRTTVIFLGDNGTWDGAIVPPFDPIRGKSTIFEGGVRVPLIVRGPPVSSPGSSSAALVALVDLFPTVLDLAGADPDPAGGGTRAGSSLVPWFADPSLPGPRTALFTEQFTGAPGPPWTSWVWTLRDDAHKLIGIEDGGLQTLLLYDLTAQPYSEGDPIDPASDPAHQEAFDRLVADHAALMAATPTEIQP